MRVPFIDLTRQYASHREAIDAAIREVVAEQRFILGPRVEALEKAIAERAGARFGVACASGTDALVLAFLALGIGAGDEVVTTAFSFFASASAIARVGATPVFVDIDPRTFTIDPVAAARAIRERPRVRAVLPVHLFGLVADLRPLLEAAAARGVPVVEDACQAIGAKGPDGRAAGGIGTLGCFSFYPTKNLGAYGDGGCVTTSDERLAARLRSLRFHGSVPPASYHHEELGLCSRLDALQAAILLAKNAMLDRWNEARRANAAFYERALAETPLELPAIPPGHIVHQYTVRVGRGKRDSLKDSLKALGIDTSIFYPTPLHLQPALEGRSVRAGPLAESERAAEEVLSLPIFPELREEERVAVADGIRAFFRGESSSPSARAGKGT